ncbi:DUF5106 domain-containing protein [Bacteroides sedimenti]|uniref:DUF5106 domain-containing protein n=1 Tax=Bacteroides sedimenti TaxID=2136147 RepID=A0ABN6Z7Y0_9BACE
MAMIHSDSTKITTQIALEHAVTHFWDDFLFENCNTLNEEGSTLALKYYVDILSRLSIEKRQPVLGEFLKMTKKYPGPQKFFIKMLCDAYSLPSSIYKNEDIYIFLLNYCLQSNMYESWEKQMYSNLLKSANQNRPGKPANNFCFTNLKNSISTLYNTEAEYLILYFYNPECEACRETSKVLEASNMNGFLKNGKIKLLAISLEPNSVLWHATAKTKPFWLHGQDAKDNIQSQGIYDLSAIPTLYLLDKHKNVILKDCKTEDIISYLNYKHINAGK